MPRWRPSLARALQRLGLARAAASVLLGDARSGKTKDVKRFFLALDELSDPAERSRFADRLWSDRTPASRPHGLPARLVVSLTSYPKRYPALHHTLRCLLEQSVRADRVILWIAHTDLEPLPRSVLDLQARGLEIKRCDDRRSYNKILPTFEEEPEAFIVTADDDLYYPVDWLERLVAHARRHPRRIAALRARLIERGEDGTPKPYADWKLILRPSGTAPRPGAPELVFPTGVGGVIYPPGALRSRPEDLQRIVELAPHADDIGLFWIWRSNGFLASAIEGEKFDVATWPGSQIQTLMSINVDRQGNDGQLRDLVAAFGTEVFCSRPVSHTQDIVEAVTRQGHRMRVDPTDSIGHQILERGVYDGISLDALAPVLGKLKPRTLLDIGANIGNHSLAWAGRCTRLHAFEPSSTAFALLKHNVETNALHNVALLNFGLSDVATEQTLYIQTQGNLGASSLHNRHDGAVEETVSLRKGDEYLASQDIHDVDFIKIDVEGHERFAFLGLKATLAKCRPFVFTEWSAESSERGWLVDPSLMRELFPDYDVYTLIKNSDRSYWSRRPFGSLMRGWQKRFRKKRRVLMPLQPEQEPPRSAKDVLLVPREKSRCLAGSEIFAPLPGASISR